MCTFSFANRYQIHIVSKMNALTLLQKNYIFNYKGKRIFFKTDTSASAQVAAVLLNMWHFSRNCNQLNSHPKTNQI